MVETGKGHALVPCCFSNIPTDVKEDDTSRQVQYGDEMLFRNDRYGIFNGINCIHCIVGLIDRFE